MSVGSLASLSSFFSSWRKSLWLCSWISLWKTIYINIFFSDEGKNPSWIRLKFWWEARGWLWTEPKRTEGMKSVRTILSWHKSTQDLNHDYHFVYIIIWRKFDFAIWQTQGKWRRSKDGNIWMLVCSLKSCFVNQRMMRSSFSGCRLMTNLKYVLLYITAISLSPFPPPPTGRFRLSIMGESVAHAFPSMSKTLLQRLKCRLRDETRRERIT